MDGGRWKTFQKARSADNWGGRHGRERRDRAVDVRGKSIMCADSFGESTPNKHHNGKDKQIRDEMFLESKHVLEAKLRFGGLRINIGLGLSPT